MDNSIEYIFINDPKTGKEIKIDREKLKREKVRSLKESRECDFYNGKSLFSTWHSDVRVAQNYPFMVEVSEEVISDINFRDPFLKELMIMRDLALRAQEKKEREDQWKTFPKDMLRETVKPAKFFVSPVIPLQN